tara:strand:+ start:2591 stop:2827 length:237 start_codon:yes stop_codon:yes gene_type:complete
MPPKKSLRSFPRRNTHHHHHHVTDDVRLFADVSKPFCRATNSTEKRLAKRFDSLKGEDFFVVVVFERVGIEETCFGVF